MAHPEHRLLASAGGATSAGSLPPEALQSSTPQEASGLFNNSNTAAAFNANKTPFTSGAGVGGSLAIPSFLAPFLPGNLQTLIDQGRDIAEWAPENLEIVQQIEFATVVALLNTGLPAFLLELFRLQVTLDEVPARVPSGLLDADLSGVLPDGWAGDLAIDRPAVHGTIILGFDMSSSPFYVLTQPDALSPTVTTELAASFGIAGNLQSSQPLLGTQEDPIVNERSATAHLATSLNVDFSGVAADPALQGKLRFDNLGELANLSVDFDGDPLDQFVAIVDAEVGIPGLKASATSEIVGRQLTYQPPASGFGVTETSFKYYVRDTGDGKSPATESSDGIIRLKLDNHADGGCGTTSPITQNGLIAGALTFLDVNGNGVVDTVKLTDPITGDPLCVVEPSHATADDGTSPITIPDIFDQNQNGAIEPPEGTLVSSGGTDISTQLPFMFTTKAPGGATMITPLTTLISKLIELDGSSAQAAQWRLRTAFGLPPVDLLHYDAITSGLQGEVNAPSVYVVSVQVQNTVLQVAALSKRAVR